MASNEVCECILPFSPPSNRTPLCKEVCVKEDKKMLRVLGKVNVCECVQDSKRVTVKKYIYNKSDPEGFSVLQL